MGLEFLKRVQRATAVFGAVAFVVLAVYYDVTFALGFLTGCLWGVANFWALGRLLRVVVTPAEVDRRRAYLIAGIKFPVLYAVGYFILRSSWFGPVSLLAGFSSLFLVIVLKAAGRALLHLNERAAPESPIAAPKK